MRIQEIAVRQLDLAGDMRNIPHRRTPSQKPAYLNLGEIREDVFCQMATHKTGDAGYKDFFDHMREFIVEK